MKFSHYKFVNILFSIIFFNTLVAILFDKQGLVYYMLHFISLLGFLICFLIMKHNEGMIKLFLFVFSIFSIPLLFHLLFYSDPSIAYIIVIYSSIMVGYIIYRNFLQINFTMVYYITVVLMIVFILVISPQLNTGNLLGNTDYLNRTYYTVPLTLLYLSVVLQDFLNNKYFSVLKLLLFTSVAVLSFSRSTMVISFLILFYIFIRNFSLKKIVYLVSFIVMVSYVYFQYYEEISSIVFFIENSLERVSERGLDTGRYVFWKAHIEDFNMFNFIFGFSIEKIWHFLDYYWHDGGHHTLHNSMLQAQIYFGLVGILVWLYFIIVFPLYIFLQKKQDKILVLLVYTLFLAKASFETMLFVQRYDYIFYAFIFLLLDYFIFTSRYLQNKGNKK